MKSRSNGLWLKRFGFGLYGAMPVAIQNAAISAWGYRTRSIRYSREFWRRLEWLESTQYWGAQQIGEYQADSLARILKHAYETVPLYRRRFQALGLTPADIRSREDLGKLPILTKADVREAGAETLLSSSFSRRQLRAGLTSGTTGSPLTVWMTPEALQFQWAVWWRHKRRFGLSPGDKYLTFGARLPIPGWRTSPPFWRRNRAFNQTYLSTYHLTPSTMKTVWDWLVNEPFTFFTGYPSAMYVLACFMEEHGITLPTPPRYVVSGSDALLPAFERLIGEAFGAPVTDQYGSGEACGNFARCELGKYHLDAEFGLVELLPIEGSSNRRLRRIVFTGFANLAMPFIRYDIGDVALISEGPCECGRATQTLDRIDGRTEDFVRTPDGRMVIGLNQAFEWAPGVAATQIVQERIEEISVLVVPGATFGSNDLEILEYELRQRVGDKLRIEFRIVDGIPLTKAGKFRAVVSRVPVETDAERSQRRMIEYGIDV